MISTMQPFSHGLLANVSGSVKQQMRRLSTSALPLTSFNGLYSPTNGDTSHQSFDHVQLEPHFKLPTTFDSSSSAKVEDYLGKILNSRVYDIAIETQLQKAHNLSTFLDNEIHLKREDTQPAFSFKVRGAYNKMVHLSEEALNRGVVACSAGNHAQGVALAAKKLGCRATIVMPTTAPTIKVEAVKAHGGPTVEIRRVGDTFDEAAAEAHRLRDTEGLTLIHPFDDPHVIAGQGTIGHEILKSFVGRPLDAIFVSCGGGGMLAGIAAYVKSVRPEVKVIGVEATDAAGMTSSLLEGKVVPLSRVGLFADGAAVKTIGTETFRLCRQHVDAMINVDTDEICNAIKLSYNDARVLLEPAGALAVAGMKKYVEMNTSSGKSFVAVTSGANMDFDRLRFVSERADRSEKTLAATIPESPGTLRALYSLIWPRTVTEFTYRFGNDGNAQVLISFQPHAGEDDNDFEGVLSNIQAYGFPCLDMSNNDLAKGHIRHLAGAIPLKRLFQKDQCVREKKMKLWSRKPSSSDSKESDSSRNDHGLVPGDHVLRWTNIFVMPIQVHGVVVSAGPNLVTIVNFGYSSSQPTEDIEVEELDTTVKRDNRLNIVVLSDPNEIKRWKIVHYGDPVTSPGVWENLKSMFRDSPVVEEMDLPKEATKKLSVHEDDGQMQTQVEETAVRKEGGDQTESRTNSIDSELDDSATACSSDDSIALDPNQINQSASKTFLGGENTKKAPTELPKLPKSDPPSIVLARVRFLLEEKGQSTLPKHHLLFANSECIAVWCKTGRFSTLQSQIFLHSTAVGNAKSAATVALVAGAQTVAVSSTVPAAGVWGWIGFTTTTTSQVGLLTVCPWLVPLLVGYGVAAVGTPYLVLLRGQQKWNQATQELNDMFWQHASPEVFVDAIHNWSGLRWKGKLPTVSGQVVDVDTDSYPNQIAKMEEVIHSNDDLSSRHGSVHSILMNGSESGRKEPSMLDLSLSKCLESIQTAAVQSQQSTATKENSTAVVEVTRDLASSLAGNQIEEDIRTSCSDSDEANTTSPLEQEVCRLRVVKSYLGVLDSDHGIKFERLTALACRIFRTPMALVTIADLDKVYCISSRGFDFQPTTTRQSPFCSHALLADCDMLVVKDAWIDKRFAEMGPSPGCPPIRFYAGAPLTCPEGYRLGTLCVMDSEPRTESATLEEKQSLMELAAMAMETLVELRQSKQAALKDPAQQIACTAHDLLTPLTGIALSLSLLKEDEALQHKLTESQRDMIDTAANCSAVMNSICHKTMDFFRDQGRTRDEGSLSTDPTSKSNKGNMSRKTGPSTVKMADLVKNLNSVMEPFPKQVPIVLSVEPSVPPEFVSDDIKLFRSATNYLSNACAKTESGSIHFRIFTRTNIEKSEEIVFECEDTGPGVDVVKYPFLFKPVYEEADPLRVAGSETVARGVPEALRAGVGNSGLGLYSVATQISSIGGKYGFRPRGIPEGESGDAKGTGSIFWFAIPLVLPVTTDAPAPVPPPKQQSVAVTNDAPHKPPSGKSGSDKLETLLARKLGKGLASNGSSTSINRLKSEDALEAYASSSRLSSSGRGKKRYNAEVTQDRCNRALVIEDSLVVRKSLARVLSKLGFEVSQAVNGMEGLKELKASLFDLVLCDFLMPVMDGLDCIQQYRKWEKVNRPFFQQYIIGISAHASDTDVQQGHKVGMDDFRSKPVSYNELKDILKGHTFTQTKSALDKLGHEVECLKRRKVEQEPEASISASPDQRICLVVESSAGVSKLAELASERIGWKIVSVQDPDSGLGLLKMRNWDAVLVDDELGCSRCITIFREWEKAHRVNRQRNVLLMSANFAPQHTGASFHVPTGFDGALGKPIELDALTKFLTEARSSWEIVTR
eukprot:Nitzschia sp. Nitz4//scaffold1_size375055//355515//362632//NITZ4_000342-RA/size375055-processed-gene-0.397-mRNA-1//1//CDS//3329541243//8387//frame0